MGPRCRRQLDRGTVSGGRTASRDRSVLSSALELAADAILLMDRQGRILEATGAASDIFGRSAEAHCVCPRLSLGSSYSDYESRLAPALRRDLEQGLGILVEATQQTLEAAA